MFLCFRHFTSGREIFGGSTRTLKLPSVLAPTKAAVLPLKKKRWFA
jgi:glycyl-tRNA synthetase (class II)